MRFVPYVYDANGERIPVVIAPMTQADAEQTDAFPEWRTSWSSDFLKTARLEHYSVKVEDELVALGAYEIQKDSLIVYIVYMESQPESNPTMVTERKYKGIGRLLVAYGIKLSVDNGFGGDVILRAKTTELEKHYVKDFGAVKLPSFDTAAPRYIIADEAAKRIFFSYLE